MKKIKMFISLILSLAIVNATSFPVYALSIENKELLAKDIVISESP